MSMTAAFEEIAKQGEIPAKLPYLTKLTARFNNAAILAVEQLIGLISDGDLVKDCFSLRKELHRIEELLADNRLSPFQLEATALALNQTLEYISRTQALIMLGQVKLGSGTKQ